MNIVLYIVSGRDAKTSSYKAAKVAAAKKSLQANAQAEVAQYEQAEVEKIQLLKWTCVESRLVTPVALSPEQAPPVGVAHQSPFP